MTLATALYLVSLADTMSTVFWVTGIISLAIIIIWLVDCVDSKDDRKRSVSLGAFFPITLFISIIMIILIPSKQDMYLMLGANYLQKSDIPTKVELVLEKKLDDLIKDKQ